MGQKERDPSSGVDLLRIRLRLSLAVFLGDPCVLLTICPPFIILGELVSSNQEVCGASAHSDYGMITLLATDGVPGLQACLS